MNYSNGEELKLEGVLFVPNLKVNILSLGKLDDDGFTSNLGGGVLSIFDDRGNVFANVRKSRGSMYLIKLNIPEVCQITREEEGAVWLWHFRLCHQNFWKIDDMRRAEMVSGLPKIHFSEHLCKNCLAGKQIRRPFPKKSEFRASKKLQLIHGDIYGPIQPSTVGGRRYYFLLIDDFSRLMWVAFLKDKSDAFQHFKKFKNLAESESEENVKCFRTDIGGEFNSEEFIAYCDENGIKRHLTAPYSPQQNGVVERKNRTIMSCVRSTLKEKNLPLELWAEAVNTCVYVLNRSYTKSLENSTPYERWSERKPNIDHLRVFGSVVHVKTTKRVSKLEDRSNLMVFIGYELGTKAYRCLDPLSFKVTISGDVVFEEHQSWDFSQQGSQRIDFTLSSAIELVNSSENSAIYQNSDSASDLPSNDQGNQDPIHGEEEEEERSGRYRSIQSIYEDSREIDEEEVLFISSEEPTSYEAEIKEEIWRNAMKEEMESIDKNLTWVLIKPPVNCRPIGVKWIYKVKRNSTGEITRHKARPVAKGYSQKKGKDYDEVFSPVARAESIRILLALSAQFKWKVHHLDVKSAFLNGEIEEEIYVHQPVGFIKKGKEDYVLRLKKALYGLKQAPRAWNYKLDCILKSMGFIRSVGDQAVYILKNVQDKLLVGVSVDDLIITGSNTEGIEEFKTSMKTQFEMTDFGLLNSYLGIEVIQEETEIKMCQSSYALKVLDEFNMKECNPAKTPMEYRLRLNREGEGEEVDSTYYRKLIGCLRYLTLTRPDLIFPVSYLSRFMSKPYSNHLAAAKRLLRYIKGTSEYGLIYKRDEDSKLVGFCDSDYAGDQDDRMSTSGYIFLLGSKPIAWNCSKQKVVALSSCEAKYISSTSAVCQGIWISRFVHELIGQVVEKFDLYIDNKSAIEISRNPVYHGRTKHIEVRYHFIRNCVEENKVILKHVRTDDQLADLFTKPLGITKFIEFRRKIGLAKVK